MAPAGLPTDDPIVAALLAGPNLARLAYITPGGRPRVVPIWFAHDSGDIIMVTGPKAAKLRSLEQNPAVAVTIDSSTPPYKVLLVEGEATLEPVEGMAPEYRPIVERYLGVAAESYLKQLLPRVKKQVRIRIAPRTWRVFDFVKRYPKSLS
jgi:PPOX class probable F420-dependent enzyme